MRDGIFSHTFNGLQLIRPTGNVCIDSKFTQITAGLATVNHSLQFIFAVKTLHFALSTELVIPQKSLKTIGVKNNRSLTMHGLQAVGIQFCLTLALSGISHTLLGFDYRQRQTIITPQHIVCITHSTRVGA